MSDDEIEEEELAVYDSTPTEITAEDTKTRKIIQPCCKSHLTSKGRCFDCPDDPDFLKDWE